MTKWQDEFKKKYGIFGDGLGTKEEILAFIEKTLSKQQEDIQRIMGKLSDTERRNPFRRTKCCGYHQALSDLETKLKTLNKE